MRRWLPWFQSLSGFIGFSAGASGGEVAAIVIVSIPKRVHRLFSLNDRGTIKIVEFPVSIPKRVHRLFSRCYSVSRSSDATVSIPKRVHRLFSHKRQLLVAASQFSFNP